MDKIGKSCLNQNWIISQFYPMNEICNLWKNWKANSTHTHTWKLNGKLKNIREEWIVEDEIWVRLPLLFPCSPYFYLPLSIFPYSFTSYFYTIYLVEYVWLECMQAKATTNKHDIFSYCILLLLGDNNNMSIVISHFPNDIYLPISF